MEEDKEVESRKKVDEEWKQRAETEKHVDEKRTREKEEARRALPEATFMSFLGSLIAQTLVNLGATANPLSGKKEVDLQQASFTIDCLKLLQEKTKGNLTAEETAYLDRALYELQMAYLQSSGAAPRKETP